MSNFVKINNRFVNLDLVLYFKIEQRYYGSEYNNTRVIKHIILVNLVDEEFEFIEEFDTQEEAEKEIERLLHSNDNNKTRETFVIFTTNEGDEEEFW